MAERTLLVMVVVPPRLTRPSVAVGGRILLLLLRSYNLLLLLNDPNATNTTSFPHNSLLLVKINSPEKIWTTPLPSTTTPDHQLKLLQVQ